MPSVSEITESKEVLLNRNQTYVATVEWLLNSGIEYDDAGKGDTTQALLETASLVGVRQVIKVTDQEDQLKGFVMVGWADKRHKRVFIHRFTKLEDGTIVTSYLTADKKVYNAGIKEAGGGSRLEMTIQAWEKMVKSETGFYFEDQAICSVSHQKEADGEWGSVPGPWVKFSFNDGGGIGIVGI